jgi:hypothetical protein
MTDGLPLGRKPRTSDGRCKPPLMWRRLGQRHRGRNYPFGSLEKRSFPGFQPDVGAEEA